MKSPIKRWIHLFGALPVAVGLLTIILAAMAAGTIVESIQGTATAGRVVYYSMWFQALLFLFALNLACSLIDLFPWGRQRVGYILTHGSILLILVGSLATELFKIEGRLGIWEGEENAVIITDGPGGEPGTTHTLPFSVHLDSFEIDYYQGTRRPAMFRSRVTVHDRRAGKTFPAVIEMNRELSYAGYSLFQSSYQQTPERDQTVLLVSKDPGQSVVFLGYCLMMAGMLTVLGTRIGQRVAGRRLAAAARTGSPRRVAAALFVAVLTGSLGGAAMAQTDLDPGMVETLRRLPVQNDGRVMPLDTMAREATWKITGRWSVGGTDPVETVLGWTFDPQRSATEPIVRVGDDDLVAALGLPASTRYASFQDLARNPHLMTLLQQARAASQSGQPVTGVLEAAQDLEGRLVRMQGFLQKSGIRSIPAAGDPLGTWSPPVPLRGPDDLTASAVAGAGLIDAGLLDREVTYNRVRPSRLSWWILMFATGAALAAWIYGRRPLDILAAAGLCAGFGMMTWGLAVRWQVAGRIPASNMYESLLFLGWGVGLFALIAVLVIRNRLVVFNATAMSALTMTLADLLPIDPFIHPMPPVLSGTAWLAIHVPIIMVSYSVLALGVLVAHLQIGVSIVAPARRDLAARMNDMLYWYMHVGSILLIAGILTGSIWAASSWGRYWGWDPKEVWSLIAFMAYLAILHGRFDRLIGPFGVAVLSIVAFWTIVMTYVGVNYVLAAGLHSYGFGGSGVVRWMLIVAILEGFYLAVGWLSHTTNAGRKPLQPRAA